MGFSSSEKSELATYELKDMSHVWYVQLRDNRPLTGGPMTWEMFKKNFLYQFFPREKREDKVVDFINLHQAGMSFH